MTVETLWEPDKSKQNTNEGHVKGLAKTAQNPVKIRTKHSFSTTKSYENLLDKFEKSFSNST